MTAVVAILLFGSTALEVNTSLTVPRGIEDSVKRLAVGGYKEYGQKLVGSEVGGLEGMADKLQQINPTVWLDGEHVDVKVITHWREVSELLENRDNISIGRLCSNMGAVSALFDALSSVVRCQFRILQFCADRERHVDGSVAYRYQFAYKGNVVRQTHIVDDAVRLHTTIYPSNPNICYAVLDVTARETRGPVPRPRMALNATKPTDKQAEQVRTIYTVSLKATLPYGRYKRRGRPNIVAKAIQRRGPCRMQPMLVGIVQKAVNLAEKGEIEPGQIGQEITRRVIEKLTEPGLKLAR